jgi:hypothetical protein
MINCISLPSQIRRRIAVIAQICPPGWDRGLAPASMALAGDITALQHSVMDIARAVLQGSPPASAVEPLSAQIQTADALKKAAGQSPVFTKMIDRLRHHTEALLKIVADDELGNALKQEKYALPTYKYLNETVALIEGQLMAETFRLFLESFGIQVILGRESAGVIYGFTVGPLGEVDLNVAPELAADARILLDTMQRGYFVRDDETGLDEADAEDQDIEEPDD